MDYSKLPKNVQNIIKPPLWNSYYYVSTLLRKAYEKEIPELIKKENRYKILDYGCGAKPYKYLFGDKIEKYVGVDVGDNPDADVLIQPGEKLSFKNNEFDIILSSQVLEHVEDVDSYMKECNRVLKDNGLLMLSTHGTWQYHAAPYDFNRWTSVGLKSLFEKYQFKVNKTIPVLGQLAVTSQLRLSFFDSFANMIGPVGRFLLAPFSLLYQLKMRFEDLITPQRVKLRDSAIFLLIGQKVNNFQP